MEEEADKLREEEQAAEMHMISSNSQPGKTKTAATVHAHWFAFSTAAVLLFCTTKTLT